MSSFLPALLSWLQEYGYPALWLSIFFASIGLPLPISLVLLGAGAFAALGDFNVVVLAMIAVSASVGGDSVGYWLGRTIGGKVLDWLERQQKFHFISPRVVARSRVYFQRRGGWAIFLSRFLFSALGGPINLLAGAELYSYRRFLFYDATGEALGALIPLTLGFIFGAGWEALGDILGTISTFVLALVIAVYLILLLIRMIRRMKASRVDGSYRAIGSKEAIEDITDEKPDTLPL
ncbi:MAG: DedA family protein [Chloroflexi bacterium]|nr:DedA family protein [Chloroflexota bacterium]